MGVLDSESQVDDSPSDSQEELVKTIHKNLRAHAAAYRNWRTSARESYNFVASEQWTDEEKQALEDSMRTPIVFNRVARTINAVLGLELQNRQEVSYKPVSVGATGVNDLMNSAAKWARSNCDAEDEESEAFSDTLICGIGATDTLMEYSSDLDGMIVIERCDPFECAADHTAKKRNFDDKRWTARWKGYSKEEFESMYPGVVPEGSDPISEDNADVQTGHNDDEYKYKEQGSANDSRPYTVIKYQYYKDEEHYRVSVGGELKTLTKGEYDAVSEVLAAQGVKSEKQQKRVYKQVILCRDTILNPDNMDCPIDGFTIRFITGLRDRNRNTWFGLVELMKDPQRWANKWLSQIQYIINSNAKGGLLYEANTFTNPKKAKADWAKPNTWIEVAKGALTEGRIKDRTPPAYPDGIDRLLSQALTAINDVPGVNVEMLGLANRNQPGIVEDGRKDAGVTILASFFDALRRYRKENGRVLMKFIQGYISDGRLIRIDGANAQYVPLVRDGMAEKYDILVDDAPTSSNMKQKTFEAISSILPIALQSGIPIPPEVLEYSPLPSALTEKWMKLITESKAPDQEKELLKQQVQQMAEELKITVAAIENKEQETAVKAKDTEYDYIIAEERNRIDAYNAETERMKLAVEKPVEKAPNGASLPDGLQVVKTPEALAQEDAHHQANTAMQGQTNVVVAQGIEAITRILAEQVSATQAQTMATERLTNAVVAPRGLVLDANNNPVGVETLQ
jgi:hypothetical protein